MHAVNSTKHLMNIDNPNQPKKPLAIHITMITIKLLVTIYTMHILDLQSLTMHAHKHTMIYLAIHKCKYCNILLLSHKWGSATE